EDVDDRCFFRSCALDRVVDLCDADLHSTCGVGIPAFGRVHDLGRRPAVAGDLPCCFRRPPPIRVGARGECRLLGGPRTSHIPSFAAAAKNPRGRPWIGTETPLTPADYWFANRVFDDQDDPTPHEPDEPDPEGTYGPEIPSVEAPDTSEIEVSPALAHAFWSTVISVNVGVLAVSLGLMGVYFEGWWRLGGGAVVLGIVLLGYAAVKYRVAKGLPERGA